MGNTRPLRHQFSLGYLFWSVTIMCVSLVPFALGIPAAVLWSAWILPMGFLMLHGRFGTAVTVFFVVPCLVLLFLPPTVNSRVASRRNGCVSRSEERRVGKECGCALMS